jgi:predicted amidohydrolase YtcJ
MKLLFLLVLLGCCFATACTVGSISDSSSLQDEYADVVYSNGRIYTVDDTRSWAQAFAIKGGRFVYVGKEAEAKPLVGPDTEQIDLNGRFVMPGIQDLHAHLDRAGFQALYECNFPFTWGIEQILERVRACADEAPEGTWIRGGQWAYELMDSAQAPNKDILDAIVPDHPVFLMDSTLHAAWMNSKALAALEIDGTTPDPDGGSFVRKASSREPSGIAIDNAAYNIMQKLPPYTPEQYKRALTWSIDQMNRVGVVSIKEALADGYMVRTFHDLDKADELNAYIAACLPWKASWTENHETELANISQRQQFNSQRLNTSFAKIFADGVPPARSAAFLEPYLPDHKHPKDYAGTLRLNPEELTRDVIDLDKQGLTIKIHSTGDRAVRVVLDAFEAARKANGDSGLRHEVSHASYIHPDDYARFKALNVTAELCPIMWYPGPLVDAMIGVLGERGKRFFPIRSLYEAGTHLIYGSDWPSVVPSPSPWPGIEAMITRQDPEGVREGSLWAEQAIDLPTVIDIFTINGAIAMRKSDITGSIEVGKSADFIVLNHSLFEIPPQEISDTTVYRTVFQGRVVYDGE